MTLDEQSIYIACLRHMPVAPKVHRRNFNDPGDAHELTFCCYKKFAFLKADRTRLWFAEAIQNARKELEFDLWAYVFMPEHVHVVVFPRRAPYDIADIRKAIKEPVGRKAIEYLQQHAPRWLPRVTRQRGKRVERLFWQSGGGYDRNVKSADALLAMIDYIHLNPVRRGLVQRATDWEWSSAAYFIDGRPGPLALDVISPEWLNAAE